MKRLAVAGGGVAGLSAALHLLQIAEHSREPVEIVFIAPLVPTPGGEGSGLGGKAMSRSFTGRYDAAHENMDRHRFYGPAMPHRGTIPHGYHVLWGYPNLRRMLTRPGEGPDLGGMLRPPGGAGVIASFQGLLDDPTPGGPGVGLMGLCDPEAPETATREATRALLRLRRSPVIRPFFLLFEALFGAVTDGLDPLAFADLLFAGEVDLEMRLALIVAAIEARGCDPERETMVVDGMARPLCDVEYDVWAEALIRNRAGRWLAELHAAAVGEPLRGAAREVGALVALLGVLADGARGPALDSPSDVRVVWGAIHTILDQLPAAANRLASGNYPVWRTLHFRFAPDATFASPYSFDAAQAIRSLAFCFLEPKASRMWSPDGGRIQALWLRLWEQIRASAARLPHVTFTVYEGRVHAVIDAPAGVRLEVGQTRGHGPRSQGKDLGYPHQPDLRPPIAPQNLQDLGTFDAFIPAMPPALLADILSKEAFGPARSQLAPLAGLATMSTELLIWTREPITYAPAAREGLRAAAITGLEGPFCLLADYRCGLWSDAALAAEDPFGTGDFRGAVIESCGGYADLWASKDRDDAFGWPTEAKEAIRGLLDDPARFETRDLRPWPHDDSGRWKGRVADGTWRESEMEGSFAGWFLASRWMVWAYLNQLSQCQALGALATRQFAYYAGLVDPRGVPEGELAAPSSTLLSEVRWVVMRNANRRSRFFNPGVGDWGRRPVSGLALTGTTRVFPAGDWTRNGLDVVCMEAACISAMRAAEGSWTRAFGHVPKGTPTPIRVLPPATWYSGNDPLDRG